MGSINLCAVSSICHLSCQGVILFKCHIVGGISNPCIIKNVFIVENNPEVVSERQFIQTSVHCHLLVNTAVLCQVNSCVCNIAVKRL